MRSTYIVSYDITEDKRRDRVFKICKNWGVRLQFSVFECDLDDKDMANMRKELGDVISSKTDQVLFVDLGPTEGRGDRVISTLGRAYTKFDSPCYIV